jgi:hypothetical protein
VQAYMRYFEPCLLMVLSMGFTILPMIIPWGGLLLAAFAPFPILILAVKYHWTYALGAVSIEGTLCWFAGGLPAALFFAQYNLAPLVMAVIVRQGGSIARTIASGVAVPLLGGGLLLSFHAVVVQEPLSTLLARPMEYSVQAVRDYGQLLAQSQELDEEQLRIVREELPQLVMVIFPAMLVMNYGLTNTLAYLLARRYCQHEQPTGLFDPEDVAQWKSSDYLVWVFLGSGAALFLPFTPVSTVALNIFLITLAIYFMHGLAIATFWGRRLPLPSRVGVLLAVMLFIIAGPLCVLVCTAAGLFDLWVDFRRLRRPLVPW